MIIMQKEVLDNISANLNFTSMFSLIVLVYARKHLKCLSSFWFFTLVHLEQGRIQEKAYISELIYSCI